MINLEYFLYTFKFTVKYIITARKNYYKKFLLFFFNVYKNEWKEHKF